MTTLQTRYPWTTTPLVVCAPMRQIAMAPLAVSVSAAGGLGFIGAGSDLDKLDSYLNDAAQLVSQDAKLPQTDSLPIGFGIFNWAPASDIEKAVAAVAKWKPAAAWMYGAHKNEDYAHWAARFKAAHSETQIWIQIGSVADAIEIAKLCGTDLDVLVVQGTDAGGHGLEAGAGIITLLPEVTDALSAAGHKHVQLIAAGGIIDGRGAAAALALGADGVCLGTRLLASEEATITSGYRNEVVRASDGGMNTARTKVYDQLRGTTSWPVRYNGRGILNQSYRDHQAGMKFEENQQRYNEAMKAGDGGWGLEGRITTYAGTGVGLVKRVMKAADIVAEIQDDARRLLKQTSSRL